MAENSKIEWCDHTFNHVRGCTKVSPGCKNCYADTLSKRNPLTLGVWGPNGTRVVAAEAAWKEPVKWNREAGERFDRIGDSAFATGAMLAEAAARPRVFCASLADVFEDWPGPMSVSDGRWLVKPSLDSESGPENWQLEYPESWKQGDHQGWRLVTMSDVRRRLFRLIDATPNLDWLVLTKRPENIAKMMPHPCGELGRSMDEGRERKAFRPRPNLWLGTSVENQAAADERIPHLLKVPAAVRFLSCEPLLSEVNIRRYFHHSYRCPAYAPPPAPVSYRGCEGCTCEGRIDWVIGGGESGPGARPCNVAWIRSIVEQCKEAGVACFVKQLGANVVDHCDEFTPAATGWPESNGPANWENGDIHLKDKKGGDMDEWPESLRIREFPTVKAGAS